MYDKFRTKNAISIDMKEKCTRGYLDVPCRTRRTMSRERDEVCFECALGYAPNQCSSNTKICYSENYMNLFKKKFILFAQKLIRMAICFEMVTVAF